MSRRWRSVCASGAAMLALFAVLGPAVARADSTQESLFQDDGYLIYRSTATVNRTLGMLKALGVQRIRVNVTWSTIAPHPTSRTRPVHFDASAPAAYPLSGWVPYDRIAKLAAQHGMGVQFNITAPGPLWAMRHDSPTARAADHWAPNPTEFFWFVYAVGRRYSGTYGDVPRVSVWSVWNEPNQPGWLAPQWRTVGGSQVPDSPRLYRIYVDVAYSALRLTGHIGRDTILIGELAPEGYNTPGDYVAMTPMPFLRALYCLDGAYRPLRGSRAAALGCPTSGSPRAFVNANPALFYATGFAHHPYYFFKPPWVSTSNPDFAPLANLGRLERGLDRDVRAYGVRRQLPIYVTEYGYQTKPPDPYQVVTTAEQAVYLNAADYMAWRDPRVRSMAQFLLYDAAPDLRYRPFDFGYWDTFQTGLLFVNGRPKPALDAYRMPIWIPTPHVRRGGSMFVWGQLRAASHSVAQSAAIQWRGSRGAFRTIAAITTRNPSGYLTASVRPPGSGTMRIAWQSPKGQVLTSRTVAIRVS